MDEKEFEALFRESAEHAAAQNTDGRLCALLIRENGFCVEIEESVDGRYLRSRKIVHFHEVYAAKANLLKAAIDFAMQHHGRYRERVLQSALADGADHAA